MHAISREIAYWIKRFGPVFQEHMARASLDLWEFGRFLREEGGYQEEISQHVQVLGRLTSQWWQSGRTIWSVCRETAAEVARTGVNFLPETPPASWSNGCIILEGKGGQPLFDDIVSLAAWVEARPESLSSNYWLATFLADGQCAFCSFPCRQPQLNEASRKRHGLAVDSAELIPDLDGNTSPPDPARSAEVVKTLEFLFAFSFYAADPERAGWQEGKTEDGLIERGPKGKPIKRNGRPVPLWLYRDVRPKPATVAASDASLERGRLDTARLDLVGVIVKQHFRAFGNGKIRLVRPYPSHRWKRSDRIGVKTTI